MQPSHIATESQSGGDIAALAEVCRDQRIAPADSRRADSSSRNSAVAMAGGLVSQGLKFLVVVYVARRFSVAEFGLLSFAIAVNAYMYVVSNFGLNVFGSRAVAKSGAVSQALLIDIFFLQAALAVLGMALALGILSLLPGVSRLELFLVAIFGLSNLVQAGLFDWAFQGLHRLEVSAALNILWQGAWLILTAAGIRRGLGVPAVPAALCVSALLASVIGYLGLRQTGSIRPDAAVSGDLRQRSLHTLAFAAPLGWGMLLITVLVWSDAIAVRLLRGDQAVGLYAAGNRAALALAMLGTFYVQGAFPQLSRTSCESPMAFEQSFARIYADLGILFLPGCFWAIYYAKDILWLLFHRTDYLAAVPVFRIFQAALPLFVANTLLGTGVLVAWHKDRSFFRVLAGTAVIFLGLCPALTWRWGAQGAAVAVLASQFVSWLWFHHEASKLVPLHSLRALAWPLVAGIAVTFACAGLRLSLCAGIVPLALVQVALLSGHLRVPRIA
jgi:O-antigen/teichoic acid export membrane protein